MRVNGGRVEVPIGITHLMIWMMIWIAAIKFMGTYCLGFKRHALINLPIALIERVLLYCSILNLRYFSIQFTVAIYSSENFS